MNGTFLRHQARDEGNVAREPVQLGHDDGAAIVALGRRQCRRELRPPGQCIGALAGLDVGELADEVKPFGGGKAGDGLALGLEAETGSSTLAIGRDTDIGDCWFHDRSSFCKL